jgi:hypothetical protein
MIPVTIGIPRVTGNEPLRQRPKSMPLAAKHNAVKQHADDKADAQQDEDQQGSRRRKTPYQELYFNRGNVLNRKDQHRDDQQQTDYGFDALHGSPRG